jgi:iron complex transport system substrate-binding protein
LTLPILALVVALSAFMLACGDDDDSGEENGATPPPAATSATTPGATEPAASAYPVEVERSDGQTLTIAERPTRVVSLSPGATEIIYALGAEDTLVAVDNQADYPPEVASLSGRVDAYEPNIEAIAGFEPDLVIAADNTGDVVGALDRLNIPVLYVDLDDAVTSIDDVITQIELYGRIFDANDEAEAVTTDMQQRVDAVSDMAADAAPDPPLSVFHELDSTFYSVAEDTFIGSIYGLLRAENIAGDGGGVAYPQLTQEAIIAANPTVIVLADEEFGVTIDSVKARPGWDAIDAVANDRIYGIDPDIISRPGPRIVDALEQLAANFYPEASE